MKNILYVDCCMRPNSRTEKLAQQVLSSLEGNISTLKLTEEGLTLPDWQLIQQRNKAVGKGDMTNPLLRYAVQFAQADEIIIAAPYWDLTFPALLKVYIEYICVVGVTFHYIADDVAEGLCKAKLLRYITTSGGACRDIQFGYEYLKQLCERFFGIPETKLYYAEKLDLTDADPEVILSDYHET